MNTEETLIWKGSPSQWINFWAYFFCLLLTALIVAAYFLTPAGPLVLFCLVIPAIFAFSRWLITRSHSYEITSERIRIGTGVLSRVTTELELYRVRDYTIEEPLGLRIVGRGNIILQTADRTTPQMVIHAVPNVSAIKDQIRAHTEQMRQRRGVRDLEIDTP
jgi:uncharacterized membrane protein YdbT with pleckstrin-like domain